MLMRQTASFPIEQLSFWKKKLLHWADAHPIGIFLDNNQQPSAQWECLVAAGAQEYLVVPASSAFEQLRAFKADKDWLFGYFSYDLKNEIEALHSHHPDGIGLADLGFFWPETVVSIAAHRSAEVPEPTYLLEIQTFAKNPIAIFEQIRQMSVLSDSVAPSPIQLQPRISEADYLRIVESIRQHIALGDLYEMNFCQEFYAVSVALHPVAVFERLNAISAAPFTTFLRWQERYLLSASPERFLKKTGNTLVSQPIKGTRKRGQTAAEDALIRAELAESEKDRSENVMIVDLVRNDFSRNCMPGTVEVTELCGIHTFATVHQMISTVCGQLDETEPDLALRALRHCFPMGSMTGAPKVMAMELIERYEQTRRGLYSGAVGYFDPKGDFDFNVVIRSILYNKNTGYVSAQVGGAIVYDSVPEQEYEECLVKAEAMFRALSGVF